MTEEKPISRLWTVSTTVVFCLSIAVFYALISAIKPMKFDETDGALDSNNTELPPVADFNGSLGDTHEIVFAFDSDGGYGFHVRQEFIIELRPNSTAALAGLAIGDEILSVNDERIEQKHMNFPKNQTIFKHFYYFFTKIIFGYSTIECLIENAWTSGNGTVKLVVRRNMEVFKKVVRAYETGAVIGFGDFGIGFGLVILAMVIQHTAAVIKATRTRGEQGRFIFYQLQFWPLRLMRTSHPITHKEFDENFDRVLSEQVALEQNEGKSGDVSEESCVFENEKDTEHLIIQA